MWGTGTQKALVYWRCSRRKIGLSSGVNSNFTRLTLRHWYRVMNSSHS